MRKWRIGFGLVLGLVAVLAGPSWLVWDTFRPRPWDSSTLRIRFDSVRFERAGLVFSYIVENRTWRDALFQPPGAEIKAIQERDLPVAGYPNLRLPLELPAHSEQMVEIRLEIPSPRHWTGISEEQTRRILANKPQAPDDVESPGSALPMLGLMPPEREPQIRTAEESLRTLDGFELVDAGRGVRIRFPRGW